MYIPEDYEIAEKAQYIKRGETLAGVIIDVARQIAVTPYNLSMSIVEGWDVDGDVVSPVWFTGTPTAADTRITLPDITPGAGVAIGNYLVIVVLDGGAYVNSPRYIKLTVF